MVSESSSASFLYVPSVGVDVFACVCDVDACGVGVNVCSVGACIVCFSVRVVLVGHYSGALPRASLISGNCWDAPLTNTSTLQTVCQKLLFSGILEKGCDVTFLIQKDIKQIT